MAKKPSKRITTKRVQETEDKPFTLPDIEAKAEVDEDPYEPGTNVTPKERRFILAYVGPAAGNATKAAEMAGYNAANRNSLCVTGHQVLRKPRVQAELGLAFAAQRNSPEWTRNRFREIASSSFANVCSEDKEGELKFDSQRAIENGALGQIKEIREELIKVGDSPAQVIKRIVKMHDPTTALTNLAKMQGILIDRTDVTSGGKPINTYADIDDGEGK